MSVQSIVSGADITFTYGPEKGVRYLSEGVPRRLAPGSRAPGRHVTAAMAPRGVTGPGRVFGTKFKRRRAGRRLECLETGRSPRAVTSPPAGRLLIYCSRRRRHAGPAPGSGWVLGPRRGPGGSGTPPAPTEAHVPRPALSVRGGDTGRPAAAAADRFLLGSGDPPPV